MIARFMLCLAGPRDDATRALSEARVRLAFAKKARTESEDIAERTREAVYRNHFREAVEYQFKGANRT